jgi:hypothetical protein
MTNSTLKTNNAYGASVGHRTVFTRQGAIDRYKAFLEACYNSLDTGSAIALSEVESDLERIGLTRDEIERIETEYLKTLN